MMEKTATQPPIVPSSGPDYQPVVTLNGWTMPWRMNGDWKEFHLVAEPVVREFAEGMKVNLWGYNGQAPGPTIEAVEGDKVRIFVTNRLPEHTTVHWHGMILPSGMDGVGGLTQPHIKPGQTFVYEFVLTKSGTFMYHPHSDEMVQMAMGMMGMFVVHPRDTAFRRVDRDFVFIMSTYLVDPGHLSAEGQRDDRLQHVDVEQPRIPGHRSAAGAARAIACRVRIGNLTMTNHPIHLHGHHFCGELHRRRLGPGERRMAGDDDRRAGRCRARVRLSRRQSRRLGVPLPQVAPHDERDGPRREELHRRGPQGNWPRRSESSLPMRWSWDTPEWRWAKWRCPRRTTRCR